MSNLGEALKTAFPDAVFTVRNDSIGEWRGPSERPSQTVIDAAVSAYNIISQWDVVRTKRNALLVATDWRVLPDQTPSQAWFDYRQSLRDITNQADPFNIIWPVEPV